MLLRKEDQGGEEKEDCFKCLFLAAGRYFDTECKVEAFGGLCFCWSARGDLDKYLKDKELKKSVCCAKWFLTW